MTSDGKSVKLVRLRNPWTKEKYTGPWGEADAKWTNETKK